MVVKRFIKRCGILSETEQKMKIKFQTLTEKVVVLLVLSALAFYGCSDSSEESITYTELGSSSSNDSTGLSSSSYRPLDTTIVYDTIPVFIDDTTGKELHYIGNSAIRITEVNTANTSWLDHDGEDPGWIELYNMGSDTADLRGYSIVENLENPRKWIIDKLEIPPGELRTVFCSKKDLPAPLIGLETEKHFRTHTNWKLEKAGGSVYLIDYNWGIRDSLQYPALDPGISYGIVSGGEWKYFSKPTPEKKNTTATAFDGFSTKPELPPAGFYSESVTLAVPQNAAGTLRCTFDGSFPTEDTPSLTTDKVISKTTVARCVYFEEGKISNQVTTATYFIDETINMPVMAISVNPEFFEKHYVKTNAGSPSGAPAGLYEDVEFPIHVEYFAEGSASTAKAWEIDAGISLMGNYSRLEDKKSVAIMMREDYQDGRLHYPLFETRKETHNVFKSFNLRNNGNRFVSDYVEDAVGGALLEGTGVDYQRSRQVVVFYNGSYYGIHDMRERFNKHYVETNYGIDANSVNFIKHLGHTITASNGTTADYENLLEFVATHDFSGENNENYAVVETMMDVGNFADYMAAEIYMHNGDWPDNNVRAWKSPGTLWKFMVYDLDHGFDWSWTVSGFDQNSTNMFNWIKRGGTNGCKEQGCFANLFNQLIKNPDFKRMFINRSAILFETYLNGNTVEAMVNYVVSTIDADEMTRDIERFDRESRGYGFSKSGSKIKSWAKSRDSWMREEYVEQFGLQNDISVTISSTGPGSVALDGVILPSTYTGTFFGGNAMLLTAVPSGSGVFSKWSDGSFENPRFVNPSDGAVYSAIFK